MEKNLNVPRKIFFVCDDFHCLFCHHCKKKYIHCRVVATKFYKTKIPSLQVMYYRTKDIF